MNYLVQLSRQVQYLLIALLFASFAVVQSVQAEPSEADPIGNVAEEGNAILEAAVGQAANTPNERVMPININKSLQCAAGNVILRGNVVVTFTHPEVGVVLRHSIKFEGFTGTAVAGNRKLQATERDLKFLSYISYQKTGGGGEGRFGFEFYVTGPGLPASSPFRFLVRYNDNRYKWREGKVTQVIWDQTPIVKCSN